MVGVGSWTCILGLLAAVVPSVGTRICGDVLGDCGPVLTGEPLTGWFSGLGVPCLDWAWGLPRSEVA